MTTSPRRRAASDRPPAPSRQADGPAPANDAIAAALDRLADRLAERGANEHRVRAYRRAAETVRTHPAPLADLLDAGGPQALEALDGVGENIAARIAGFVETGRLKLLRRLQRESAPARLFARVPGVGRELAERIHAALPEVETLEQLEVAAHDGRLRAVDGFGRERVRQVRAQLADMLKGHASRRRGPRPGRSGARSGQTPSVEMLLTADRQYRRKAEAGDLRTIAPRRFNPSGEAWLPLMKTRQGDWAVTALFSNTARAHDLGKTDDWVVLYARPAGAPGSREVQHTVVTETRGDLAGRRVVRGREGACRAFYRRRGELVAA